MDILLTGSQIIIGALMVFACWYYAAKAMDAAVDLQQMRARLMAAEGSLQSLYAQHQKLSGRFYAQQQERLQLDPAPQPRPLTRDELRAQHLSPIKANTGE